MSVLDGVRGPGGGAAGFAAAAEPGCLGGLCGSPELRDRSLSRRTGGGFAGGEYGWTAGGRDGPGGPDELLGSVSERPLRERCLSVPSLSLVV